MDWIEFRGVKCRAITKIGDKLPIILLHGFSFTIDVWSRINLISFLESNDIPYLALDMPYGRKSECSRRNRDPIYNITLINYAFRYYKFKGAPIVIGASLGGYIALKYALDYPVSGLILIAPVYTLHEEFRSLWIRDMPILVIYGTRDNIVSLDELKLFVENLRNGELKIYEDAGHPAYLDYPDQFKRDVYQFYYRLKC